MVEIIFVDNENYDEYSNAVAEWLRSDWESKGRPSGHFWHNMDIIDNAFREDKALVAVADTQEVIGYMIWSGSPTRAEIDIVEVKEKYQRQGIFKQMQQVFLERYPNIAVLSVSVIWQAVDVFRTADWIEKGSMGDLTKFYKITQTGLQARQRLPMQGIAIALCSRDYYSVRANPASYAGEMKYFPIQIDASGALLKPIITDFHYEGYVAVYVDGKLLSDGKAKHLFEYPGTDSSLGLLVLNNINPTYEKATELAPALSYKPTKQARTLAEVSSFRGDGDSDDEYHQAKRRAKGGRIPAVDAAADSSRNAEGASQVFGAGK